MEEAEIVLIYQDDKYSMKIENLTKSVTEALKEIVVALQLSWRDGGGNPITYHLGRNTGNDEEILLKRTTSSEDTRRR